jgi:hypothetical protein
VVMGFYILQNFHVFPRVGPASHSMSNGVLFQE